jgi:hypothetical protein
MKVSDLTRPQNHKSLNGKPMLFANMAVAQLKVGGRARISYNILTGDWHVEGQKGNPMPYVVGSLKAAICLAKTINYFNENGKGKKFTAGDISELEVAGSSMQTTHD